MRGAAGAVAAAALALAASGVTAPHPLTSGAAPVAALRIVSLNPCLDAILVQVADRPQIAALSRWSRDAATSTIAPLARRLPMTDGSAESILALRPDLVLVSGYGSPALRGALSRLRIPAATFPLPSTVAQSEAQVRRVAALAGHAERGEALVARIEGALAAATPPPGPRPTALLFEPGGFTTGPDTLSDALIRRAGFANKAVAYGYVRSRDAELERVVADPPDVLLVGEGDASGSDGTGASRAERLLAHPALRGMAGRMRREPFPARLTFCGGPVLVDALAALARARRDVALPR